MAVGGAPPAYIYLLQGSSLQSSKSPRSDAKQDVNRFHSKITDILKNTPSIEAQVMNIIPAPQDILSSIFTVKQSTLAVVKLQSTTDIDCLKDVPSIVIPTNPSNSEKLCLNQITCIGGSLKHHLKLELTADIYECNKDRLNELCKVLDISVHSNIEHEEKIYIFSGKHPHIVLLCSFVDEFGPSDEQVKLECFNDPNVYDLNVIEALMNKKEIGHIGKKKGPIEIKLFNCITKFVTALVQLGTDQQRKFPEMGWKYKPDYKDNTIELQLFYEGPKLGKVKTIWETLNKKYDVIDKSNGTFLIEPSLSMKYKENLEYILYNWKKQPVVFLKIGSCRYMCFLYKIEDANEMNEFFEKYAKLNNLQQVVVPLQDAKLRAEEIGTSVEKYDGFLAKQHTQSFKGVFLKVDAAHFYNSKLHEIKSFASKHNGTMVTVESQEIMIRENEYEMLNINSSSDQDLTNTLIDMEEMYIEYKNNMSKEPSQQSFQQTLSYDPNDRKNSGTPVDYEGYSQKVNKKKCNSIKRNESLMKSREHEIDPNNKHDYMRPHYENNMSKTPPPEDGITKPKFPARKAQKSAQQTKEEANRENNPNSGVSSAEEKQQRPNVPPRGSTHKKNNLQPITYERSELLTPASNAQCFVYEPTNTIVTVNNESITEMEVDAIVNAANTELAHYAGLAVAIANAAGQQLQNECKDIIAHSGNIKDGHCVHTSSGFLAPKIQYV